MTANRLLSIILVLCILAVTGAQFGAGGLQTGMEVQWSTLDSGTGSRINTQGLRILETEGDLQRYWKLSTGQSPQSVPYKVDWNTEKVVAIHLGQRASGGYSIYVQRIDRANASIAKVVAIERKPMPNQLTTQMITSPWTLIKVKRNAADLQLSIVSERQGNWIGGIEVIPGQGGGRGCNCNCPCCRNGQCSGHQGDGGNGDGLK